MATTARPGLRYYVLTPLTYQADYNIMEYPNSFTGIKIFMLASNLTQGVPVGLAAPYNSSSRRLQESEGKKKINNDGKVNYSVFIVEGSFK